MKSRKTYEVKTIKDKANKLLSIDTPYINADMRKGIAQFTADILHDTNNYQGFVYLDSESDLHAGHYGRDGRVRFI